ncbi:MAG: TetR/AcrR family transcriptional regulator [Candidatus Margulisbacteria bacterium]|jgi:AcrR family transcriptional regulator|nr:TetR/AcrR family transcriptional regulator [Candidatus Margulisiibacteriota bacterium]
MVQPISNDNYTKQKLVSKACEIFRSGGYSNETIDHICEAAGISKNTYYYYFKSKEDLLLACIGEFESISSRRLADIFLSGENYFEQLWLIQKQVFDFIRGAGIDFIRELKDVHSIHDIFFVKKEWQDDFELKLAIIRKAQEAGEVRNQTESRTLAITIGITFMGIFSAWISSGLRFDIEKFLRSCMENIMDLRPDLRQGEDLFELSSPLFKKKETQ